MVPNGGTRRDLNETIGTAVPEGDGVALPNRAGIVQHFGEFGQLLSLHRRTSGARVWVVRA